MSLTHSLTHPIKYAQSNPLRTYLSQQKKKAEDIEAEALSYHAVLKEADQASKIQRQASELEDKKETFNCYFYYF